MMQCSSGKQKIANVMSFSALSNMRTYILHTSVEAMLRVLEEGILPAGFDSTSRAGIKHLFSTHPFFERFGSKPLRPRASIPSHVNLNEQDYIDVVNIDGHPELSAVCAVNRYTAAGFMVSKCTIFYRIRSSGSGYFFSRMATQYLHKHCIRTQIRRYVSPGFGLRNRITVLSSRSAFVAW
jgi:hypothetical protein